MPLLPARLFAEVFMPLKGKRIGYLRSFGNVGDRLIDWAAFQLFESFSLCWRIVEVEKPGDVDELVFAGGGNMGLSKSNAALRRKSLRLGLPLTILPQSFAAPEDLPFKRVFVREHASLRYCPGASIAPDLALGLRYETTTQPQAKTCLFLRCDREGVQKRSLFQRDPIKNIDGPQDYLELAARHEVIITDRLHFAIAGLIVGRQVTLLANSYHKNEAMHATWLASLGCRFAYTVNEAMQAR